MNIATINDIVEINSIFKMYKHVFPYMRQDYLKRMIIKNSVILEEGVVIIFLRYKRAQPIGNFLAHKNDVICYQLASKDPSKALSVFKKFLFFVNTPVWGNIKENNIGSRIFHKRAGFIEMGPISWKNDTLKGLIYRFTPQLQHNLWR